MVAYAGHYNITIIDGTLTIKFFDHARYFDDVMDLFTPEGEDAMNSPLSSGNDLSMIMEDSKETLDDVFSTSTVSSPSKEIRPPAPPQFKVCSN